MAACTLLTGIAGVLRGFAGGGDFSTWARGKQRRRDPRGTLGGRCVALVTLAMSARGPSRLIRAVAHGAAFFEYTAAAARLLAETFAALLL